MSSNFYQLGSLCQTGLIKIGPRLKLATYLLAGYEVAIVTKHRRVRSDGNLNLMADTKKSGSSLVYGAGLELRQKKASPFVEFICCYDLGNLSRGTGHLMEANIRNRAFLFIAGLKFGKKQSWQHLGKFLEDSGV